MPDQVSELYGLLFPVQSIWSSISCRQLPWCNPEPLFLFKNLKVTDKRLLGSQKEHLKLKFGNLDAIAFKKGDLDSQIAISSSVDIIAFLSINAWNGNVSPQLMVKEIFPI